MKRILMIFVFVLAAVLFGFAQEKPAGETQQPRQERPLSYYKIVYALRELQDGKVINTRNYVMTIENMDRGETKVGARVPVVTSAIPQVPNSQIQYMDVGLNLGCRVVGHDDLVGLRTTIEISSFALPEQATGGGGQPVVRQMRTEMAAVVPLGKETVIGAIDDVNSTKRYEIAVTATKMK